MLVKYNLIEDLERQVKIHIYVNGQFVCSYTSDFVYYDKEKGKLIYEDFKGYMTNTFRIKKKLLKAACGIDLYITRKKP